MEVKNLGEREIRKIINDPPANPAEIDSEKYDKPEKESREEEKDQKQDG